MGMTGIKEFNLNVCTFFLFQMDLSSFIMKNQCEALNESDSHPFSNSLNSAETYLESDADEQVTISFSVSR